jgi:hypothetical protein
MKTGKDRVATKRTQPKSPKRNSRKGFRDTSERGLDWGNPTHRGKIFLKIMREILKDPNLGEEYLRSDAAARKAFEDQGMKVPPDVKVVFLPAGDTAKLAAGSAVIELPKIAPNQPAPTDDDLAELFVANYPIIW